MKFIHFLYENDYNIFPAQNLSLLQNEQSFFSKLFRQHRKNPALQDSMPAAGRFSDMIPLRRSALLPGGLYFFIGKFNEISYKKIKRKIFSSAFIFSYTITVKRFFGQPFTDYLFLCKKSGIFKDLVATLERKSVGGFWMPLNAWLTLGMAPVLPGAITTGFLAASCPFT